MNNKILILSPLSDIGGRELEVGFIASIFSKKYQVKVISTANYSNLSQVKTFKGFIFKSLNEIIFTKSLFIRTIVKIISFFNKNYSNNSTSLSNPLIKQKLNIESKKIAIIKSEIIATDLVFICAQLSSNYIKEIILIAYEYKKQIIFRTTGQISKDDHKYLPHLKFVDLFLHHSLTNAQILGKNLNYKIIDQCAFNETFFLKIPIVNKQINNFMTVSRIEKSKNIDVVIKAFCKSNDVDDRLYVVGTGSELDNLIKKTKDRRVIFTGFMPNNELYKIYKICECFIVSYYKLEAGPFTAIEAMAAGKIIISSKTGAMTERLIDEVAFWHNNDENVLFDKISEVKSLSFKNVQEISEINRNKYISDYSIEIIRKKYLDSISFFMS